MKRSSSLPAFGFAALLMSAGCSGGSAGVRSLPPDAAPAGPSTQWRTAPAGPSISGVIKTTNWVVPKGKTLVVNRSLAVFASDSIDVEGDLIVQSGASIGLISDGSVTIAGTIRPGLSDHPGSAEAAPGIAILGGKDVSVNGTTQFSGNVSIATSAGGDVTIRGGMSVQKGANGTAATAPDASQGARSGGTILIGTPSAALDINTWIGKYDPHLTGFNPGAPDVLTIARDVRAGDGGDGYSDVDGKAAGITQVLVAGDGANGGNVDLQGRRIVIGKSLVAPGSGGDGGDAGFDAAGARFDVSMDGDAHDARARALKATLGNGGNAGTVSTSGFVVGKPGHAYGGAAGTVEYARAGNGGPSAPGGATTILTGSGGTGFATGQAGAINLADGGSGGGSNSVQTHGGAGGTVAITDRTGGTAAFSKHLSLLSNYANGGAGFNGCPTQAIGTNGGSATSLNVSKTEFGYIASSFDGGNGGDGIGPAGTGGSPGYDAKYVAIGVAGSQGDSCNSNFAFLVIQGSDAQEYSVGADTTLNPLFPLTNSVNEAVAGTVDPVNPYYYVVNSDYNTVSKDTIDVFSLTSSGHAAYLTSKPLGGQPAALATDGSYVYAGTNSGQLAIFKAGSTLSQIGVVASQSYPAAIVLDPYNVFEGDVAGVWSDFPRLAGGSLGAAVGVGTSYGAVTAMFDNGTNLYVASAAACVSNCSDPVRKGSARKSHDNNVAATIYQYAVGAGGATPLPTPSFTLGQGPLRSIACTATLCFVTDDYAQVIWQLSVGAGGALTLLPTPSVSTNEQGIALAIDPSGTHLYQTEGPGQIEIWNITPNGLTPLTTKPIRVGFAPVGMSFYDFSAPSRMHRTR